MAGAGAKGIQVRRIFEEVEGHGKRLFDDPIDPPGPKGDEEMPSWLKYLDDEDEVDVGE